MTSNIMWSSARSDAARRDFASLEAQLPVPIDIKPMRRARRMRLRLDEARGRLKLTCPWRTNKQAALAWAIEQRGWIEAQLARSGAPIPLAPGSVIAIEGVDCTIVWDESLPRRPKFEEAVLVCGGPEAGLARRIEAFLREHALAVMSAEVAEFAGLAQVSARSVRIGDATSRWGSCSSDGRIRLNWRLILAPPDVRRYVVAHEVAHLRHLDHGAAFKALELELVGPGREAARAALKALGPGLRRIGRRSL